MCHPYIGPCSLFLEVSVRGILVFAMYQRNPSFGHYLSCHYCTVQGTVHASESESLTQPLLIITNPNSFPFVQFSDQTQQKSQKNMNTRTFNNDEFENQQHITNNSNPNRTLNHSKFQQHITHKSNPYRLK